MICHLAGCLLFLAIKGATLQPVQYSTLMSLPKANIEAYKSLRDFFMSNLHFYARVALQHVAPTRVVIAAQVALLVTATTHSSSNSLQERI